jgi:thymidylate synthase (FAD)
MKNIKVDLRQWTSWSVLQEALRQPYSLEDSNMELAKKVIKTLKHESVAEHINFSFLISGVSRAELQEHMRHRISSTTCRSTRFTLKKALESMGNVEDYFVIPEYVASDWDSEEQYNNYRDRLIGVYNTAIANCSYAAKAGAKNDYLKYFLPEGFRTQFFWTINLRSLLNFLKLRKAKNAHFEIRRVAELIEEEVKRTWVAHLL